MDDVEAVGVVLRSLADARDGPFYDLWIELLRDQTKPQPEIGFRIFRAAMPTGATSHTVVGVSGVRSDGRHVAWTLALDVGRELSIVGSVEIDEEDGGSRELYVEEQAVTRADQVATAIGAIADKLCAQRHWWDPASTT